MTLVSGGEGRGRWEGDKPTMNLRKRDVTLSKCMFTVTCGAYILEKKRQRAAYKIYYLLYDGNTPAFDIDLTKRHNEGVMKPHMINEIST